MYSYIEIQLGAHPILHISRIRVKYYHKFETNGTIAGTISTRVIQCHIFLQQMKNDVRGKNSAVYKRDGPYLQSICHPYSYSLRALHVATEGKCLSFCQSNSFDFWTSKYWSYYTETIRINPPVCIYNHYLLVVKPVKLWLLLNISLCNHTFSDLVEFCLMINIANKLVNGKVVAICNTDTRNEDIVLSHNYVSCISNINSYILNYYV
jgi:hypothetical protein